MIRTPHPASRAPAGATITLSGIPEGGAVNQNLLYIVARANVDRIYGDLRFDFIDDDFTEAVVSVAAAMPAPPPPPRSNVVTIDAAPVERKYRPRRGNSSSKIVALADRLRVKR